MASTLQDHQSSVFFAQSYLPDSRILPRSGLSGNDDSQHSGSSENKLDPSSPSPSSSQTEPETGTGTGTGTGTDVLTDLSGSGDVQKQTEETYGSKVKHFFFGTPTRQAFTMTALGAAVGAGAEYALSALIDKFNETVAGFIGSQVNPMVAFAIVGALVALLGTLYHQYTNKSDATENAASATATTTAGN